MNILSQSSRSMKVLYAMLVLALILFSLNAFGISRESVFEEFFEGKAKIREGSIRPENVNASPLRPAFVAPPGPTGFTPQTRLGFNDVVQVVQNEWEPAIASD